MASFQWDETAVEVTEVAEVSPYYSEEPQSVIFDKAEKQGFTVVTKDDTYLLLDLDGYEGISTFNKNWETVKEELGKRGIYIWLEEKWQSKSNNGWHYVISMNSPLPLAERLVLQSALGSDSKRDFWSLVKSWRGESHPVALFRPPSATVV